MSLSEQLRYRLGRRASNAAGPHQDRRKSADWFAEYLSEVEAEVEVFGIEDLPPRYKGA